MSIQTREVGPSPPPRSYLLPSHGLLTRHEFLPEEQFSKLIRMQLVTSVTAMLPLLQ